MDMQKLQFKKIVLNHLHTYLKYKLRIYEVSQVFELAWISVRQAVHRARVCQRDKMAKSVA